jgi:hypothetical protein
MVKAKIFENSRNRQLLIIIRKKQFPILKDKTPKFINIDDNDFEF